MKEYAAAALLLLTAAATPVPDRPSVTAEIGVEAALDFLRPVPAAVCETCNGTGKTGDGRIVMVCPACGGTGKPKATCESGACIR